MNYLKIFTSIAMFFMVIPAMAQGAPPATPIDGGLSLLLAAGGVYGAKKLHNAKKNWLTKK